MVTILTAAGVVAWWVLLFSYLDDRKDYQHRLHMEKLEERNKADDRMMDRVHGAIRYAIRKYDDERKKNEAE